MDPQAVREARERLGYSIDKTGEEGDLSPNSVLRAEHGEEIRPSTARRLARALNVEVKDLYPKAEASPSLEPSFNDVLEEERRLPTAAEMKKATATLERLIARRREAIERWRAAGVGALEEAACGWFDMDRANDQIYRDLRHLDADEVIRNQRDVSAEDLEAAVEQTNAFGRLLGIAAEAHNVAGELSREAGEASEAAARTFAELESLRTAAQGERELR